MTSVEERITALETRLDGLRVPPVRDELLKLRDAHGARLAAIEARLNNVEFELDENTSWIERRFTDVDAKLDQLLRRLP